MSKVSLPICNSTGPSAFAVTSSIAVSTTGRTRGVLAWNLPFLGLLLKDNVERRRRRRCGICPQAQLAVMPCAEQEESIERYGNHHRHGNDRTGELLRPAWERLVELRVN